MLLFMDGASHYGTPEIGQKWTAVSNANCLFEQVAEGRTDGCLRKTVLNNNQTGFLTYTPLATQAGPWTPTITGVFAHAVKIDSLAAVPSGIARPTVFLTNGSLFSVHSGVWEMFCVAVNPNGTLNAHVINGGTTTVLVGTSIQAFNDAEWLHLQYKWTLSTDAFTADGALEIRANGQPILAVSNVVLFPHVLGIGPPLQLWNSIRSMGVNSNVSPLLVLRQCDVYLLDDVASPDPANPNNDFLGDQRVSYIKPIGPGAETNWTPSAGANWDCVDEVPPDDAERVTTTAAGTRDTYEFQNVLGDPLAIQTCHFVKKDIDAAAELSTITRHGGVDFDSPAQGIGSTDYDYRLFPEDVNPATNLQYTQAEMDAGEWGPLKAL